MSVKKDRMGVIFSLMGVIFTPQGVICKLDRCKNSTRTK